MNKCTNAHTHTHARAHTGVPYGADPEHTHARTHTCVPYGTDPERTRTHTPVFPMVQTQNACMHTHTPPCSLQCRPRTRACAPPPHTHLCSLWCRDRTQVARAHECWKAESCPGGEPGGLAHVPEARLTTPGRVRTQGTRGQPRAPSRLRGVCVSTCQRRKHLLIPRALRMVLPLQRRQKVKPSAVLITLNKV